MHEFTSPIAINMLTLNHGNLTRNPKLDNREVYNTPMKDRPIVKMMMQNSAHISCLKEADAFFSPNDEKSGELIKTFIRYGYKGIVIKQWSSTPIACFVRGGPSARVELLARHISTSPHPSRSEAPHGDEGAAQPKYRMRRPAPPSVEEERMIKPFSKKPITFMFHATYGSQLYSIMEHGLKSGKAQSNPSGRMHVRMACIDDVILDDDESETALTHVPAGRDALLILAFLKDQDYGSRLSEERTALTDKTMEARNIVAAFGEQQVDHEKASRL